MKTSKFSEEKYDLIDELKYIIFVEQRFALFAIKLSFRFFLPTILIIEDFSIS